MKRVWARAARRALAAALRPFRPPLAVAPLPVAPRPDEQILPTFANAASVSRPTLDGATSDGGRVVGMDLTGVLADGGRWQLTERLCLNPADGQLHVQIVFAPKQAWHV